MSLGCHMSLARPPQHGALGAAASGSQHLLLEAPGLPILINLAFNQKEAWECWGQPGPMAVFLTSLPEGSSVTNVTHLHGRKLSSAVETKPKETRGVL